MHALIFNVSSNTLYFRRPAGAHRIATFLREEACKINQNNRLDFIPRINFADTVINNYKQKKLSI